ncbi:MAG: tRNA (cytidine(56)-2'-O)-methyltransferase [Candidatus Heimdallarchaeaceae archaeon]|jgi:tRNA (cytidine56-2'-O)-methyltransferase
MTLAVLRLSHRIIRDKRTTTHLALTARAFGATDFYYSGEHDDSVEDSVKDVSNEWGGNFLAKFIDKPSNFITEWKQKGGKVIHLTMFGIELSNQIESIKADREKDFLIVVGGAKVPGFMYQLADYNTAIGHQPHSEVAALAIFLDCLSDGEARKMKYPDAKIEIIPTEQGKRAKDSQSEQ